MAKFVFEEIGSFFQSRPKLNNTFLNDSILKRFAIMYFPNEYVKEVTSDLELFGERVVNECDRLHIECENSPPTHKAFDAWGNRTDELITCDGWKQMKRISAEEGLISIAYERNLGIHSRMYQMMKLFLFGPSSGLYSCPLAMTDGAAKSIEKLNLHDVMGEAYSHLTSRDPNDFWTCGQWMTERKGGSDVANGTETVAVPQSDGSYKLHGFKWFSSATDADMALTLARIVNSDGQVVQGTRGLSMFYVKLFDEETKLLNGIQIKKLKNKLGTRQLPTAELLLSGTRATCISEPGRGVPGMSSMLMVCRIHTALHGIANMRRIITLARDYSQKREAFGKPISQYPLHVQTLARMEVHCRAALLFLMEVCHLLGKDDFNEISEHEAHVLRILLPLIKLFTCKQTMQVVSEGLEAFGGQGYIEDTGLPSMLRDSQVLPIWEGTTNILSLDVLRSISKSKGDSLAAYCKEVSTRTQLVAERRPDLAFHCEYVSNSAKTIVDFVHKHPYELEPAARDLAYSLSRTYMGMLLLDFASHPDSQHSDVIAAERWCNSRNFTSVVTRQQEGAYSSTGISSDYELVM